MKCFNFIKLMLVTALISGGSIFVSARDYVYLSENGSDENNGASFEQAYATFSKAMEVVSGGGTIYVKGMINIYNDPANTSFDANLADTKTGFVLTKSLTIRGESKETCGFTGETDDVYVYEPFPGVFPPEYHKMGTRFFRANAGIELTLKDLTFTKAYGRHQGIAIMLGGGKLIGEDLIFLDNEAITGSDNGMGAAIFSGASTGIYVKNSLFRGNKSPKGGAIYIADTANPNVNITFESCSFIENGQNESANPTAGAIFLRLTSTDGVGATNNKINLINCTFAKNTTKAIGGAVQLYGVPASTIFSVINCTFTDNTS